MAVYYKFKSAREYDSIPIEGQFISVAILKERIFETKHLGRGTDFDLMVSNAQTNEEYVDQAAMIPKNTSVLIRRVPGRLRKSIVTQQEEPKVIEDKVDVPPPINTMIGDMPAMKYPEESEWDEFGNDLYSIPESNPSQPCNPVVDTFPDSNVDEESKIKALVDSSAYDWNRQTQNTYGGGRGFGRGMGGRMMAGRGFGQGGFERRAPPAGYVCHRCKVSGHFIQHCPTNGDSSYDVKRTKPPTGIPKSMLVPTPDGSYTLPGGTVAVLRPNEAAFEREIEGMPTTRTVSDLPPELRCPLCKDVMKDAVLTSRCCFSSFCDKCIRDYLITNSSVCVCGAEHVMADFLLPNKTVRDTISRMLEPATSSTENAGSLMQVQDTESALPVPHKVPSPTLSAASKDVSKLPTSDLPAEVKEGVSAVKAVYSDRAASEKRPAVSATGEVPEPMAKELKPTISVAIAEDNQGKQVAVDLGKKKKKKKRVTGNAADMQWKSYPDLGHESFAGMPLAAAGYNQFWSGGMPLGMDGYMAPMGGPMPYMSYTPGPFDFNFGGGLLPQDPFAAQGYMMPLGPRNFTEFGMNSMGMNNMGIHQGPPIINRDDFEARKAEMRRKHQMDWRSEREREQSNRERDQPNRESEHGEARRESCSLNDVSSMKSKPRPHPQSDRPIHLERADKSEKPNYLERADRSEKSNYLERADRSEKPNNLERADKPKIVDRHKGPSGDSARHSPPRLSKRKSADYAEAPSAAVASAAAEDGGKADLKHKGSVFSRISFPESSKPDEPSSKRKKSSSSSEFQASNGLKEYRDKSAVPDSHHEERRSSGAPRKSSSSSGKRAGGGGYDHESSEEERHFKRRPSSSSRREASEREQEAQARHSRGLKEREGQERGGGGRERDRGGHERHSSKRR